MSDIEQRIKHLEFVQNIITRMNTNSFQIKGMSITIIAALLALFAATMNPLFILIAVVPTSVFWSLDAYYLQQERKFRGIYNNIASNLNSGDTQIQNFKMPIQNYKKGKYSYWNVFISKTVLPLYLTMILFLVLCSLYAAIKLRII